MLNIRPTTNHVKIAKDIASHELEEVIDGKYQGILLCEGEVDSVDVFLYQKVYYLLKVIPVGGCTDVVRILSALKKRSLGYPVYGMIDRDSLSKEQIRLYQENGVYCTKLPFIENIISSPEVVNVVCKAMHMDGKKSVRNVSQELLQLLTRKLLYALPINFPIRKYEKIRSVTITFEKADGTIVSKKVDETGVMYSYRDKAVANETARILGINGKKKYYIFFKKCLLNPELCDEILKSVRNYLPEIELEAEQVE